MWPRAPSLRFLSILLLSLFSLTSPQAPQCGSTFCKIGPFSPLPSFWPPPREKANAEFIANSTTFYDPAIEDLRTVSNYAILYGGQNPTGAGTLFNDGRPALRPPPSLLTLTAPMDFRDLPPTLYSLPPVLCCCSVGWVSGCYGSAVDLGCWSRERGPPLPLAHHLPPSRRGGPLPGPLLRPIPRGRTQQLRRLQRRSAVLHPLLSSSPPFTSPPS